MDDFFRDLLKEPENILVAEAAGDGYIPVGYTCSYVPEVLLTLGKLFPLRLRAPGITGTEQADTYLSSVICSYSRSLLEYYMNGRYDFLQGSVCAASCDHLRRLYDNLEYLAKPDFNFIFDVPHKTTERALEWFIEEINNFITLLAGHYEITINDDVLSQAIVDHNSFLDKLRAVGDLRLRENPPVSGVEFHRMLLAASTSPRHLFIPYLEKYRSLLEERSGIDDWRARFMVLGSELDDPGFIEAIESQGGLVVADRFCTGSLPGLEPIEFTGDPVVSIAGHYLFRTFCPRMMEAFNERIAYIIETVKKYRVDGVIIQAMKFCDIWGVETSPLVAALREEGIPVLRLEREYRLSGEGQLKTRVQAFIESMGK